MPQFSKILMVLPYIDVMIMGDLSSLKGSCAYKSIMLSYYQIPTYV